MDFLTEKVVFCYISMGSTGNQLTQAIFILVKEKNWYRKSIKNKKYIFCEKVLIIIIFLLVSDSFNFSLYRGMTPFQQTQSTKSHQVEHIMDA